MKLSRRARFCCVLACIAWFSVAMASSLKKSAAIDEVPHLGAGLSALHYFDFRMNPEHPPLIKLLAALPAYIFYRPDMRVTKDDKIVGPWADGAQMEYGHYLLFRNGSDPTRLLFFSRIVPALIGLLGGIIAYNLGKIISRSTIGGLISATLLLLYPEYIGHARFLTFDVPTLVACGAVSWTSYRWWRNPTSPRLLTFAATAAVASQVKLPVTVFIVFVSGTFLLLLMLRRSATRLPAGAGPANRPALSKTMLLLTVTAVAIYLACWASAGFRFAYIPAGATAPSYARYIPPLPKDGSILVSFVNFFWKHHLLPETTLATIAHVGSFGAREMFLWGEYSITGWYYYYLVTIALKTSILYQLALIISALFLVLRWRTLHKLRRAARAHVWLLFLLPYALLFLVFAHSRANIGHRYVLFMYLPFAAIIGTAATHWLRRPGAARLVCAGFIGTQLLIAVVTFPHFETYFNEFIRTPYNGAKYLGDSNVDWGQDLPLAGEFWSDLDTHKCNYAAFGMGRAESYGIRQYNWLLPNYPFAVYVPPAQAPDPRLMSIISINALPAVQAFYPGMFDRPPHTVLNSMLIFDPYAAHTNQAVR